MNLPIQNDDLAETWAELRSRKPRPWFEELAARVRYGRTTTLVGPATGRLRVLANLAETLDSTKASREAILLWPGMSRRWTFGQAAAEPLHEIVKEYTLWTRHDDGQSIPLVRDTLLAIAADRSRLLGGKFREFLRPYMDPLQSFWPQGISIDMGSFGVVRLVSEWMVGPDSLPNTVSFLRQACALGLFTGAKLAFDALENGPEANLKSLEKLLALTEDCGTTFSIVLGWSGESEVLTRIEALTPKLATELKRTAFPLPT